MAKYKTEFELEYADNSPANATINIIGKQPESMPYVNIENGSSLLFIKDKDLERFAVNILRALGSDKLKSK